MNCDVGEATEGLENEQSTFSNLSVTTPTSQLILQPFRRFTNVTVHSPTLPLLHYVTAHPPTLLSLLLRHLLFTYVIWRAAHGLHILRRIIRKMDRPARSPDLNHLIFLWEFVKDQVYRAPVRDLAG